MTVPKKELLKYRFDWEVKVQEKFHPSNGVMSHGKSNTIEDILDQKLREYLPTKPKKTKNISDSKFNASINYLAKLAQKKYEEKKYAESIDICKNLVKLDNSVFGFTSGTIAACHIRNDEHKKAYPLLKKVLEKSPSSKPSLYNMALVCRKLKKFNDAEKYASKFIKLQPKDIEGHIQLGHILESNGKPELALKFYSHAHKINPKDTHALSHLVTCFDRIDDTKNAIIFSDQIVKLEPKNHKTIYENAIFYSELGNHRISLKKFQRALKLDPNNIDYLRSIAIEQNFLQNNKDALKICNEILKLNPTNPDIIGLKGALNCEQSRHKIALQWFEKGIELHPKNANLLYSKGLELDHLHKSPQSIIKFYDKAIQFDKKFPEPLINKAVILFFKKKNPKEAYRLLKKALKISPNHRIGIINLIQVTTDLKKFDELETYLNLLLHFEKPSLLSMYYEAVLNLHKNNKKEVLRLLKLVLKNKSWKQLFVEENHFVQLKNDPDFANMFS